MKNTMLAVALIVASFASQVQAKPYFRTIFQDPSHPKVSASALYTSQFKFDGAVTDVAIVYHKADEHSTLWPQRLLDIGMVPLSWTLLELGGGGNSQTAFVHGGLSINVAQTLLGPLTQALNKAGGTYALLGRLLVSPDGSGLKLSLGWKTDVISNGGLKRFNDMSFPPRYGFGYIYVFGN